MDILKDFGYEVIEAEDGGALGDAIHEKSDVILLDAMMPGMDGFEVLKRLNESPTTEELPVIMLTVLDAAEGEPAAMDLGASFYLTKPWDAGMVETAVKLGLRSRESSRFSGVRLP